MPDALTATAARATASLGAAGRRLKAGTSRAFTVELWRGLAATVWDLRKPTDASWGDYLRFLRDQLTCLLKGHEEPMLLHKVEAAGQKTRMLVRHACTRCGRPLKEQRTVAQFPRRRDAEAWRS